MHGATFFVCCNCHLTILSFRQLDRHPTPKTFFPSKICSSAHQPFVQTGVAVPWHSLGARIDVPSKHSQKIIPRRSPPFQQWRILTVQKGKSLIIQTSLSTSEHCWLLNEGVSDDFSPSRLPFWSSNTKIGLSPWLFPFLDRFSLSIP